MEYRNVDRLLAEAARRWGDRVYVESIGQGARLTFAELDAACNRVAHFLADRGIRHNDRISLLGGNCLELLILFFGVQRYGAAVNPINVEVNAKNAGQILHDVGPRLVLWSRAVPAELQAVARAAEGEAIPFGDLGAPPAGDDLLAILAGYPASPCARRVGGRRDIGIIDYTSGTMARPKGVCISRAAYFYMCDSSRERLGLGEVDRVLEYRAMSWASPQVITLGPTLQAGAGLVIAPRFSRTRFFDWIRDYRITISAGVPAAIHMLLERRVRVTPEEVPSLKFLLSSAAPLAAAKQLEFERRYRIPIVQMCGMTEAGVMGGNPPAASRPGSIGLPMPHIRARFVDEAGADCPPGQEGELVVSGRQMASAYLAGRGRLVPIPQDGFATGDLGYMDADGYLCITGRKKDLIIRGGVNIAPMEVTSVLLGHPAVAEAATIGVPDAIYGEGIVSFVVPRPDQSASPDALLAHCRQRLSDFKLPQQILVLDALPKTDRGKAARERLLAIWRDRRRSARDPGQHAPPGKPAAISRLPRKSGDTDPADFSELKADR
jgi:acyl-coenzyme A synthetase/AMP-(fatty) acid ligase